MDEIHSDNDSTVEKLGRDPWLHTDWQDLFERVAGSSEPPLQSDTLSLAVGNRYGCDQEFGETMVRKAAECGQLLRISVKLEGLRWEYYAAKSDVITQECNWISIIDGDVLADDESLAPEAVSRDELVQRVNSKPRQTPIKQVQYIADNIKHMAPFYINDGDLKLKPRVAENILLCRSHPQIVEAASFSTPKQVNEALADVMEAVADYNTAKDALSPN